VTTDAGAIPEIARDDDTATIVAKEDAGALAAGIDALLADPARAAAQAERAHAFVAPRYTEAAMVERMEAVFREALAERAAASR
jgi:glycosyltransferase involved in cell wall biosynthesis